MSSKFWAYTEKNIRRLSTNKYNPVSLKKQIRHSKALRLRSADQHFATVPKLNRVSMCVHIYMFSLV